jgi:hypothetical protein
MPSARGTIEITSLGEDAYRDAAGEPRLTRAHGAQRFTGDIQADGQVEWLACYLPSGSARLIGLQRVAGSVDGRTGAFVMEATADHDGHNSTGTWTILPASGTGELAGIRGSGTFEAEGPAVRYHLDYELD